MHTYQLIFYISGTCKLTETFEDLDEAKSRQKNVVALIHSEQPNTMMIKINHDTYEVDQPAYVRSDAIVLIELVSKINENG